MPLSRILLLGALALAAACERTDAPPESTGDATPRVEATTAAPADSAAGAVAAQPEWELVDQLDTYGGTLIVQKSSQNNEPERRHRVYVNDALVMEDSTSLSVRVHTYTEDLLHERELVLLQVSSGGSGCPATYRILEFGGGEAPALTPEFGDCSDLPRVLMDTASFRVRFPGFYHRAREDEPGFRPPPPTTYEYVGGGRVREVPRG